MSMNRSLVVPEDLLAHARFLSGLVATLVFDHESAEDVLQDTWAYALANPPREGPGLRAWLARVARNALRQDRRSRGRRTRREVHGARHEAQPSTADVVAREQARRRVVDAVVGLDEPYRTAIVLRYLEDLPPREISRRTGDPVETVRTRIKRGLAKLRCTLDEQEGGDRKRWCVALLPLVRLERDAAATSAAFLGGVLILGTKTKILIATVTIALLLGLTWWLLGSNDTSDRATVDPSRRGSPTRKLAHAELAPAHRSDVTSAPEAEEPQPQAAEPDRLQVRIRFVDEDGRSIDAEQARVRFARAGGPFTAEAVVESVFTGGDPLDLIRIQVEPPEAWRRTVSLDWSGKEPRLDGVLDPGRYRLFLGRPGAAPMLTALFTVAEGDSSEVLIPLPGTVPTRRIRLIDAVTGALLTGATVTPWFEHGDDQVFLPGPSLGTDVNGEVEIPLLEDAVRRGGRQPTWWVETKTHATAIGSLHLRKAGSGEVVGIHVHPVASVRGRAYLPSGDPASGCTVLWSRKGRVVRTTVAEDGSFLLLGIAADRTGRSERVLLVQDAASLQIHIGRVVVRSGETAEIVIGEPRAEGATATLTGRVTASGHPVEGALVGARAVEPERDRWIARAGPDGEYRMEDLPAGRIRITVYFGDPRVVDDFCARRTEPLHLDAGEEYRIDFDLPGGVFLVTVLDAETGAPVAGAVAMGRPEDREIERDRFRDFRYTPGWGLFTGEDGKALLRAMVPFAPHSLLVRAEGYAEEEVDGWVPGTHDAPVEVTVRLQKKR